MGRYVRVLAGDSILPVIRDEGIKLSNIRIVAGAAGGPKWLVLYHFDRHLASLIVHRKIGMDGTPLHLIGSSIGAWRLTALSSRDPVRTIDEFFDAYISQRYSLNPSVKEITLETLRILDRFLPQDRRQEPFKNPLCRLSVIAVRHEKVGFSDDTFTLTFAVAIIGLANLIKRSAMRYFLKRVVFADPRDQLPVDFSNDLFSTEIIPFSENNIRQALLASGSIPLVMKSIRDIPGAPPGVYRDGGLIDYHLDLPYSLNDNSFVLYPHYTDRIIPGWFDKYRPRMPSRANMSRVLLVCPTKALVESLPGGKIPDRNDFYAFKGRDADRLSYWMKGVDAGRQMAEEFFEAVESGKIREYVEPMNFQQGG
ncbi:MAG: patatin-like phospholipase family protein [Thermodesulforhabdaceae bacterium]